jgi:hypothetical protein
VRGEPASVGRGLSLEEIEAEAKATTKKAKAAANQERADLATKHADKIDGLMEFGLGLSRELVMRLVQLYKSESDPVGVIFNKLFSDGKLPQLAARLVPTAKEGGELGGSGAGDGGVGGVAAETVAGEAAVELNFELVCFKCLAKGCGHEGPSSRSSDRASWRRLP